MILLRKRLKPRPHWSVMNITPIKTHRDYRRMLKEIDSALDRVEGGTYGECEGCGEAINPERLKAIPWARYCVPCQELRSRN